MEREMNFWDLCVACARAIGRGCVACWHLVAHMLRLSYRYWWLVITIVVLAFAAALYYTRQDNTIYKASAIAFLNGPSVQQFEQAYKLIQMQQLVPDAALRSFTSTHQVFAFNSYRVIDCLHDDVADYVDFKRKSSPTDTVKVQMQDRVCLQFCVHARDMHLLPEIETALMACLNSNTAMQLSYATYLPNLQNEVSFHHRQAVKLDSLTSVYYFSTLADGAPLQHDGNGMRFYGDKRVHLFLGNIYDQQRHLRLEDYRLQLATAPVTLENHFSIDPKPVNGRIKYSVLFLLLGWIVGCLLAEVIDKRKALSAWLKA